ncbi:MAG TPA: cytochrome c oxidase subunit II transmembrane domain-containing protein, partial [Arachnia sp.]|nr:cytochrome c oxidase subunit II transmembrane domain-containing protein [Arachnia sp.]
MSGNPAPSRRRTARAALLVAIPVMLVALTACSEGPFGLPAASTEQAHHVGNLWLGAWIASLVIGGIVWALIGWAVIRYRRKDGDAPAPRQTTYHLPLELLYTLVPFLIVGVLFFYTVKAQDAMIDQSAEPEVVIDVVGQKWSWTFNYMEEGNPDVGTNAFEVGTIEKVQDL